MSAKPLEVNQVTVGQKSRRKRRLARTIGAVSLTLAAVPAGHADPLLNQARNTYGMPGLIDMPTAETRTDGEFAVSMTRLDDNTQRNQITFQITPRISAAFRYSRVPGLQYNAPGEAWTALYDRSFDVQWTFLDEGQYLPSMAVGLRDFVGTGIYSGEYLVATKSLTEKLRATAGIGWGRLGTFGEHSGWGTRPAYDFSSTGGQLNGTSWFKGNYAPFFGLSYALTEKWTLKAEYSSDDYPREKKYDDFDRKSPFNFAAAYSPNEFVDLQMFYMYGTRVGFQFSINIDPKSAPFPSGLETAPLPVKPRPAYAADPDGWSGTWASDPTAQPAIQTALADALKKDGQILESMSLSKDRAELRIRNNRYLSTPEAVGRAVRIATRALPSSVETIVITPVNKGMPLAALTFRRSDVEKLENTSSYDMLARTGVGDTGRDPAQVPTPGVYPRYSWALGPYTAVSLFDPDQPLRLDVGAELAGRFEAAPGVVFSGVLRQKAFGDVGDGTAADPTGGVPQVRTDTTLYSRYPGTTIRQMQGAYYAKASDDIYLRATAGLFEQMYGGVSGEMLWKPADSRLALGLETDWVKKRDYNQRFDFQSYSTVTGHASAYYDLSNGYLAELDVGRYLAKDWGATMQLSRVFSNGWKVGAFATKTDISASDFGEGSFDKGIFFSIPLSWASGTPSTSSIDSTIRPLTRDGGQKVYVDGRLYSVVSPAQGGQIYDDWGRFWR